MKEDVLTKSDKEFIDIKSKLSDLSVEIELITEEIGMDAKSEIKEA
jgi:hypothetical protein